MLLKLKPALKDYLWGGTKLKEKYGFETKLSRVAEAWALSCHGDGESVVAEGQYKGETLSQVIAKQGTVLGTACAGCRAFPVLIKLIDAEKDLSVQVHPDDAYARRTEGEAGKTECWYVIDCEKGAELIYGFKKKISRGEFRERIKNKTLLDAVNRVRVKKGGFYFIEAGTLHAIGAGILLAEVQQSSNTTYRVYDYDRLGPDGRPRPLHIQKALEATRLEPPKAYPVGKTVQKDGYAERLLTKCRLFTVRELQTEKSALREADGISFVSLLILEGSGSVSCGTEKLSLEAGDSLFIGADSGEFLLDGKMKILETRL